jgi:hypothetical protein
MLYGSGYGCAFVIMQPPLTKGWGLDEGTAGVESGKLRRAAVLALMTPAVIVGALTFSAPVGAVSAPVVPAVKTATTTTITTNATAVTSGRPVVFLAQVSPPKVGNKSPGVGGTVTWILIARSGGHLHCTLATPINRGGKSRCRIDKGLLRSATTPVTVTAKYSGNPSFGPSSDTTTLVASKGDTRVRLSIPVRPVSGGSTVVQAFVKDGPGTDLIHGSVTFVISSGKSTPGVKTSCGGNNPVKAGTNNTNQVDVRPVIDGVATCTLRPGWIVNPPQTGPNSHLRTAWSITATYSGSNSFYPSTSTHTGHANPPV